MKALVIKKFGSPDNFQEIDLPIPEIMPNTVLIRVAATSVNPVDFKLDKVMHKLLLLAFQLFYMGMLSELLKLLAKELIAFKLAM